MNTDFHLLLWRRSWSITLLSYMDLLWGTQSLDIRARNLMVWYCKSLHALISCVAQQTQTGNPDVICGDSYKMIIYQTFCDANKIQTWFPTHGTTRSNIFSLKPQVPTFELRATIFEADVVTRGDGGRCDLVVWLDSGTFLPGLLLVVGQSLRGSGSMKTLSAKLTRRLYRREIIEKYHNKYRLLVLL